MKEKKYHYVYRITNIVTQMYYYGDRSCDCHPLDDIGKKYFSTSTLKLFIQDQKNNPQDYKYKIIKIFETSREDAKQLEVYLHKKFNVKYHPKFINKANQTSSKFDISGKSINVGMVSVFNKETQKGESIALNDYIKNSNNKYIRHCTNTIYIFDNNDKLVYETDRSLEAYTRKYNLPLSAIRDSYNNGGKSMYDSLRDEKNKNFCFRGWYALRKGEKRTNFSKNTSVKNTILVYDLVEKRSKRVSVVEYKSNDNYINIKTKKIKIFDGSNILIGETIGNFDSYCEKNSLPKNALTKSYLNNGEPIFENPAYYSRLKELNLEFKGWYALKESLR